jgi:hypothetical protein
LIKKKVFEEPLKNALLKLLKKAKYYTKYLDESIPVENVKRNIPYKRIWISYDTKREKV